MTVAGSCDQWASLRGVLSAGQSRLAVLYCIYSVVRRPSVSTLFPYTTLFRSFTVERTPHGDDALALLRKQPYGVVLLDEQLPGRRGNSSRSEEHTSELQSRLHLVCRLLLEKKKIA